MVGSEEVLLPTIPAVNEEQSEQDIETPVGETSRVYQCTDTESLILSTILEIQKVQEKLLSKVVAIEADIKLILTSSAQTYQGLKDNIPAIPIGNNEQWAELESWALEKTNHETLVRYLSVIGQGGTRASVYLILSKLFLNRFAEGINWTGQNGKSKFENSTLVTVITEAVQLQATSNAEKIQIPSDEKIQRKIKNWFRTSKGRKDTSEVQK